MNFWPNPQAEIHCHTLSEVEEISPSQAVLPNTWGGEGGEGARLFLTLICGNNLFSGSQYKQIYSILAQARIWNHLEFNLLKNSI